LPGIDQIPAESIKAEGRTIRCKILKLITVIWDEELPEEWKELIIVPVYKKGDKTDCNNYTGVSLLSLLPNFIQHPACNANYICRGNYWGSLVRIST
jgi:hypothetical protein